MAAYLISSTSSLSTEELPATPQSKAREILKQFQDSAFEGVKLDILDASLTEFAAPVLGPHITQDFAIARISKHFPHNGPFLFEQPGFLLDRWN